MPRYDYFCRECKRRSTLLSSMAARDVMRKCECGNFLEREQIPHTAEFKERGKQTEAVLSDGRRIPGHFGKDAPKKNPWY